jgi:hypothetical protein
MRIAEPMANLFDARVGALPADTIRLGQALADVATIGLLQARAISRRDSIAGQLHRPRCCARPPAAPSAGCPNWPEPSSKDPRWRDIPPRSFPCVSHPLVSRPSYGG